MKILVFGSLNIDKVYNLPHLPQQGETLYAENYEVHVGGKGLNQAISLARAGFDVYMAGWIGNDGIFLLDYLKKNGINTEYINVTDHYSGHAIIEVDRYGQNQMILYGGANQYINEEYCDTILNNFDEGDLILLQYETSCVEYMINKAHKKGLTVVLNPSPYVEKLKDFDYSFIDILILNESEGNFITDLTENKSIVKSLFHKMECGTVILTLGKNGSVYYNGDEYVHCPAFDVNTIDTTGAGDTFTGYCIQGIIKNVIPSEILKKASAASAIAVMQTGAAETIPTDDKVVEFLYNSENF